MNMKNTIKNNSLGLLTLILILFAGGTVPLSAGARHQNMYESVSVDHNAPFITVWRVGKVGYGNGNLTVTLPIVKHYKYSMSVDWGDGTNEHVIINENHHSFYFPSHTYGQAGDYTIKVSGTLEAWSSLAYINDTADYQNISKLIKVEQLGKMGWKSLNNAFSGSKKLTNFKSGSTDTSHVINASSMFQGCLKLTHPDLSTMDTSSLEFISAIFRNSGVVEVDLSNFNTDSLVDRCRVECGNLLETWRMVGVHMFLGATNLKKVNVRGWRDIAGEGRGGGSLGVFFKVPLSLELICSPGVTQFGGRPCTQ